MSALEDLRTEAPEPSLSLPELLGSYPGRLEALRCSPFRVFLDGERISEYLEWIEPLTGLMGIHVEGGAGEVRRRQVEPARLRFERDPYATEEPA